MAFTPGAGAVISFTVEGAQAAQRQIETVGNAFNQLSTVARAGLATLAAGLAAWNIGAYVKDSVLLAARYETLGVVMTNVGKNAGYSAAAMEGFAKGLQSTGISMIQSRESLTALAQAHVDLTASMKLARLAQDAAVIGGINSSEAFQRMVVGLQQGDVEILRNLGLNVNFQAAYALTAATLHKHVDLLTETEKTQARVNALMAVSTDIAGTYEAAMGTAGKQLSSMSRYVEDLKVKVGSVFLDGFTRQIELQTMAFKALGLAMDESLADGSLTQFSTAVGQAAGNVVAGLVMITNFASEHGTAIKSLIATYLIYKGVMLALPFAKAAAAAAGYIATMVTQGTVTWGATGAAVALARAEVVSTETALARALSSNAVAVAAVGEAEAVLAATTSVQGQFIAMGELTAAQAVATGTTQAVAVAQGEAAVATGALTAAEGAATVGAYALATATRVLTAAVAVLLSPITLIVAALSLATAAYMYFRSETEKEVKNNLPTFEDTREQLRKLNEEQKYGTGVLGENAKQIEAVTTKIKELNLAKEAKTAAMGSTESMYTLRLKSEVTGITQEIKKYKVQLGQLQEIRDKISGKDARQDLGSYEALNALSAKYTLPPARRADVEKEVQPAIDAARKRVENTTFAGDTDTERAKAKAAALEAIDLQAKNVRLGIQYSFASETNTANKAREVDAANAATRLAAINARSLTDAQALYDLRLMSYAEFVEKENALNEKEAAQALAVADEKVRAARMTVGGDPASNAQALKTAIAERDAQANKNAAESARGRQKAADAAIDGYTREFGSISSLVDAQDDLVRSTKQAYDMAGKTAEQQEIFAAQRMRSIAEEILADAEKRRLEGTADQEYLDSTKAMARALEQMGAARMRAVGTNVAAGFINDTKAMRDDTVALYADMKNSFLDTEEERVRAAAAASIRLAQIRKQDADTAIDGTNKTDAQKVAEKQKVEQAYNAYVDAVNQNADAKAMQASRGFETLKDAIGAAFDVNRIEAFGQSMSSAFGNAGAALGNLIDSFTQYEQQQRDNEEARKVANTKFKDDASKLAAAQSAITMKSQKEELGYYANAAGAAKGFFKEKTAGYKVMEGVEKTYRAFELAMEIKNMAVKSGLVTAFTGLFVASKATQTAVEGAATGASVTMAGAQASAWGVTAVVKAMAGWTFPLNLIAGAATLAAVIGIGAKMFGSVGGGGSAVNPNSAEERQKTQGAGTVLGDSAAKSDSIAHSLEIMQKNSELELDYQNGMLSALKNIASALGGAAKGLLQTAGITGGSAFGTVASSDKAIIGASHTKDITDSGVQFSGTFGQLRAGAGTGRQYEDVYTTSDGGMFRSGWSRTDTNYKNLTAEAMKPFALIFDNMGDLLVDAGTRLGRDGASLTSAINSIGIDFEVSLRGLSGQDLTDALNAGISVAFDKVTTQLFPNIQQFQRMGEGLGETLVRVASDVQGVDSVFNAMGKSLAGMTLETKESLVEAAGGLDKFAGAAKSFMQNFYSEDEQRAAAKAKLDPILAQYGLSTEGANAQKMFRDYVIGLNTAVAAQAEAYTTLMGVQQAFFDATDAAASQRKDLQDQWDELTMTPAQLQEKALLAYDPSNRALARQVALQRQLKDSTDSANDTLKDTVENLTKTRDSSRAFIDSLMVGTLSTLTPMQKYLETQRQYNDAISKATLNPSDSTAVSAAQSAATAFLTASQVMNASSAAYLGDKTKVVSDMNQLAAIASTQMTDAQRQLDALNQQVAGITQLNDTATAIQAALVNQGAPAPVTVPVFEAQRYAAGSSAGTDVLATEVKALRAENAESRTLLAAALDEVKKLREDANRNAGSQLDATEELGETVSKSVEEAVEQATYRANNPSRVPAR